ncbi:MAG: NAD-dependent succinate-semialdehyde dehydrogenase [Pleurocapsa minor GSE-CHR-MK-17-07R]|jgi:succinate-semialdehyde dehydrogenase|nr:NAD-dependent succinate-semialdehyde dehydrogenase [Pleurocapsa minor GSE-CHR-MK 17-07R]
MSLEPDYNFRQFIGGEWVDAVEGGTWDLINPATESSLGLMPFGGTADAQAAVEAASAAFPSWSRKTPYERADIMLRAAAWIRERLDALAVITTEESGKPLRESRGEWTTGANLLEYYAEEGKRVYGRLIPSRVGSKRIMVMHQPVGVVGVITAWNFPVYNLARAWAAALGAGCTIVGRPSEYTPRSAMLFAQALFEAGVPAGVVNVINGDADQMGKVMLADERCRKISFTGSTRVGKLLMDGASQTVTRLALELGGNAPVIIFPDVDVDKVAKAAVASRYRNNGQVCIAPQRFFVHSRIVEEFADRAAEATRALRIGSGLHASTDVGPLINSRQRERVEAMVADARGEGAEVITGGSRPSDLEKGYFYQPTMLMNVRPDMRIYRDEIFGPVMPILGFSDVDEALALANAMDYGLAAYVQTNDLNTSIRMYEGLEYGIVSVNEWMPSAPEAPFGGMKGSGMGRECSIEGLLEYTDVKTVFIGGTP